MPSAPWRRPSPDSRIPPIGDSTLAKVAPNVAKDRTYYMEDVHRAGGIPALLGELHRAGLLNKGTLRDCWVGALLPSDIGVPSPHPYLPARV